MKHLQRGRMRVERKFMQVDQTSVDDFRLISESQDESQAALKAASVALFFTTLNSLFKSGMWK